MRSARADVRWLLLMLGAWTVAGSAAVTLSPWEQQVDHNPVAPGTLRRQRSARFGLGPVTYGIHFNSWSKPGDPTFCGVGEGPVGMSGPVSEGRHRFRTATFCSG